MSSPSKKRKKTTTVDRPTPAKRRKEFRDARSEFRIVNASFVISVPPVFAVNPHLGVQEMLDSMVMRCAFTPRICVASRQVVPSGIILHCKELYCRTPILSSLKRLHASKEIVRSSSAESH